jgi:hypothetical protein
MLMYRLKATDYCCAAGSHEQADDGQGDNINGVAEPVDTRHLY